MFFFFRVAHLTRSALLHATAYRMNRMDDIGRRATRCSIGNMEFPRLVDILSFWSSFGQSPQSGHICLHSIVQEQALDGCEIAWASLNRVTGTTGQVLERRCMDLKPE